MKEGQGSEDGWEQALGVRLEGLGSGSLGRVLSAGKDNWGREGWSETVLGGGLLGARKWLSAQALGAGQDSGGVLGVWRDSWGHLWGSELGTGKEAGQCSEQGGSEERGRTVAGCWVRIGLEGCRGLGGGCLKRGAGCWKGHHGEGLGR